MRLINNLLNIIYPADIYCISCGKPIDAKKDDQSSLCRDCKEVLLYSQMSFCRRCGRVSENGRGLWCSECLKSEPLYEKGVAAVPYNSEAQRIVYSLKYGGKSYIAKNIAEIMAEVITAGDFYDIIVPVPMHRDKKAERGFCQTGLISNELGRLMGKAVSEDNLIRVRKTAVMSGLTPEKRRRNIEGAFEVANAEEFIGKRILLVDDLLTTGSTANECCRMLYNAGADRIDLAVFASAIDKND